VIGSFSGEIFVLGQKMIDGGGSEAALRRTDGDGDEDVTARAQGGSMCILEARLAAEVRWCRSSTVRVEVASEHDRIAS
jgi:hypothetical protein